MKIALCCFAALVLFLRPTATAAQTPKDDAPVPTLLRAMLDDYRRYAETLWHAPETLPGMGYWGTGRGNGGNEGIRAIANTALVYALLRREGDTTFSVAQRVDPALRYAAAIHVTGDRKGADNQSWGDSWQSAMWAANLGIAAWLVRDQLTPGTRRAVERIVAHEADRFVGQAPPEMTPGDTKSEENAWNLTAPAAALLLMPGHEHARGWDDAVRRFGFNTLSVEADKTSGRVVDNRPLRDWVSTAQLFPDYTLENHRFFHPVYAMVGAATMGQAAVAYRLAGRPIPDALRHNVLKEWETLQYITLPDGEWLYPQGLDWDLHDYEHLHYWTMLATLYRDPAAAILERRTAGYARRRQQINGDGSFVGPSGNLGFAREAVQAERVAFALLMHQQFPSPPRAEFADVNKMLDALAPTRVFERAGFVVHRTPCGLFSLSWKNRLMGLVAPNSENYRDTPYVTTPMLDSLAGRITLEGQARSAAGRFTVSRHAVRADKNGFVAALDATINGGQLSQRIAVATVAPGVLAYLDRVTANTDVVVTELRGLPVGIENDEVSGGRRRVYSAGGIVTIAGGEDEDYALTGNWANVDGRLGLVTAPGASLVYRAAGKPNRAGAREDSLLGAWDNTRQSFTAGQIVAEHAGLLLPNASPEETAKVAASLRVARDARGTILCFTGPDNRAHTLILSPNGRVLGDNTPEVRPHD